MREGPMKMLQGIRRGLMLILLMSACDAAEPVSVLRLSDEACLNPPCLGLEGDEGLVTWMLLPAENRPLRALAQGFSYHLVLESEAPIADLSFSPSEGVNIESLEINWESDAQVYRLNAMVRVDLLGEYSALLTNNSGLMDSISLSVHALDEIRIVESHRSMWVGDLSLFSMRLLAADGTELVPGTDVCSWQTRADEAAMDASREVLVQSWPQGEIGADLFARFLEPGYFVVAVDYGSFSAEKTVNVLRAPVSSE